MKRTLLVGRFLSLIHTVGLLALVATAACQDDGLVDGEAADGEAADGEAADGETDDGTEGGEGGAVAGGAATGAGGDSSTGSGANTGSPDCSGNPTDGVDKPDVVDQLEGVFVTTFAGSATSGTADGQGSSARFSNPVNVVIEGDGILIADFDSGRIRRASANGTVSTLTSQAGFARPFGLALAGDELFVQTDYNEDGAAAGPTGGVLWSVNPASGDATALISGVGRPRGMALLPTGTLALADVEAMTLGLLDPGTALLEDLAGSPGCPSFFDGAGGDARFDRPYGMVVLEGGDMLVADMMNHRIRRVAVDGSVSTFAGDGVPDMIDGDVEQARFNRPKDLAIDDAGNVYVSDVGNHRIRRIRPSGVVETIAGDGVAGFADGSGDEARFFGQEGLDVSADGATIYVADGSDGEADQPYHRVRKISLP